MTTTVTTTRAATSATGARPRRSIAWSDVLTCTAARIDTEEVTGSIPVSPTTHEGSLTSRYRGIVVSGIVSPADGPKRHQKGTTPLTRAPERPRRRHRDRRRPAHSQRTQRAGRVVGAPGVEVQRRRRPLVPQHPLHHVHRHPSSKLVTSNVPTARMVQVDQWQVDPHRKRGNALRSGSDAAAGLCRCIRCNNPAVDATKSDATSWHPMQPRMVISWSGG